MEEFSPTERGYVDFFPRATFLPVLQCTQARGQVFSSRPPCLPRARDSFLNENVRTCHQRERSFERDRERIQLTDTSLEREITNSFWRVD